MLAQAVFVGAMVAAIVMAGAAPDVRGGELPESYHFAQQFGSIDRPPIAS